MKMSKMKKLLCCVGVFAFATVGGVMAMPTAETVDVKADSSSFMMLGGSIRLNATTPGIRFQASISDDYYQAIANPESETYDATAVFGMMIAPVDYMAGIDASDDYIVELSKKDLTVSPIIHYSQPWQKTAEEGEPVDTNWYINGSISNVRYENSNREFFGIAFMRTGEEGSYVYTYPELESIDAMTRSMSGIAIMAREDTEHTYSEDQYTIIDKYIARGVNLANGEALDATPNVTVSMSNARSMFLVGETVELSASFAPNALDLKLTYESSNPEVAKVTGNTVEILKAGEAEITATVKNYGTTLNIIPATMTITAGTLEMSAPNYMAVGKSETLSVTFNGMDVPGVEYSMENATSTGASVTPNLAGESTITANVSYEGVTASLSKDVTVVDFGATSGEMVDLATNLNAWNYNNYNNAEGVELSYTTTKIADGRPIANTALHYYRPDNTGASSGTTGKLVYLHPEIVDLAKAQGYKYLTYFILVPMMSGVSTSCSSEAYVVNADGSVYWGKDGKTINFNWNASTTNWIRSFIDLSKIPDGLGVGFIGYGQNIYLTNVQMIGSDGSAINTTLLDQSTINNQVKTVDLAKEELLGKLFVKDMSNSTLSIETGVGYNGLNAVVLKRDAGTYSYSVTNKLNGLVISSEWIQAAKAKGCTCFVLRYYNAKGGLTVYKVKDNDTGVGKTGTSNNNLFTTANAVTNWGFIGISLDNFKPGERIVVSFAGDTLKLSNLEFRTTYYASSLVAAS